MKVYAFDCDDTLWVSNGPVQRAALEGLIAQGNVVGLCGNWPVFVNSREVGQDWRHLISFLTPNPLGQAKAVALATLSAHIPAEEHVFVGNIDRGHNDQKAAKTAGWRFIKEDDFARGVR